jgi:GNAT superfamily N-acetyltransferase
MEIRRAKDTDEEALANIRRSAILALAVPTITADEALAWAMSAAPDRVAKALQKHEVWVAMEGGPIGWIEINQDHIAALYVLPTCARQGVGSALLAYAETAILNAGHAIARLESSPNALNFYLRRCYIQSGSQNADGSYPLYKALKQPQL